MKRFRIVDNCLSKEGCKAFHPYCYRIEERYTILFFIHWWGTPHFEPPHYFEFYRDAKKCILEHCQKAKIMEE